MKSTSRNFVITSTTFLRAAMLAGLELLSQLVCSPALAPPRDAAADRKITEAMTVKYASGDRVGAEALLLGIDKACTDQCSAQVRAKIWLYIGLVRAANKTDDAGANAAFEQALRFVAPGKAWVRRKSCRCND